MKPDRILYRGEALSITDLARRTGLKPQTLHARLRRGLALEVAIDPLTHGPRWAGRRGAQRSPWVRLGYFRSTGT